MKRGILVGGNWIIDQVKIIDAFPEEEKLVNILAEYSSNGGSAYNILKGLFKLDVDFPLYGLGLVGDDERGDQIIRECEAMGIDTIQIIKTSETHTSYTDVMTVKSSGKRTFFHQRGANALLDKKHFNFNLVNAKIFHLGYLLLLDKLDMADEDNETRAAKVLKDAQLRGFITTVDLVSERSDRFKDIISPSLKYIDYLFVNEFEASMISGIKTMSDDGEILLSNCYQAAIDIIKMGVKRWVILHFPFGSLAVDCDGNSLFQASIDIPTHKIEGSVGAGDAFAAGVLMGIHDNWEMQRCLKLGVCAAASSLFAATSSDAILSAEGCLSLSKVYGFKDQVLTR